MMGRSTVGGGGWLGGLCGSARVPDDGIALNLNGVLSAKQ